jgi:hypothetical protein
VISCRRAFGFDVLRIGRDISCPLLFLDPHFLLDRGCFAIGRAILCFDTAVLLLNPTGFLFGRLVCVVVSFLCLQQTHEVYVSLRENCY